MIASFDIGIKNLGIAIIDPTGTVIHVDCIQVTSGGFSYSTIMTIRNIITNLVKTYNINTVLTEQQYDSNVTASRLEMLILGIACPLVQDMRRISPQAVKRYIKCPLVSYSKRKQFSVSHVMNRLIDTQPDIWIIIQSYIKKDDMCDAIINAWYALGI